MKFSIRCLLTSLSLLSFSLSAFAEPAQSSLQFCEEKTKTFLKTDYVSDPKIPKTFFTPEFAALWLKACNPLEGETIYWGADPILETQDTDPKLLSLGPAETGGENIAVPVVYKHQGAPSYSKVFVFTQHKGRWVIADIITAGLVDHNTGKISKPKSELQDLKENLSE